MTSLPRDDGLAAGRVEQPAEDAEGGGLARAVGADIAEDFALANLQGEAIQRDEIAVLLGQRFGLEDDLAGTEASERVDV